MTSRKKKRTKGTDYLPTAPEICSDQAPSDDWYARASDGLRELNAESEAKLFLVAAFLNEKERTRKQTLAWLAEDKAAADTVTEEAH